MGQVLHGSATTTEVVRRAIQHSKESLRALAKRHGVNQKTVAKWRKRSLQATIPHLTRSSLHRCLQRHGISQLPEVDGDKPVRAKFKAYPIGYFHVDLAEVRTEQGKLYLLVAIDRTSKFAFVELHEKATRRVAGDFLRHLAAAVPYRIHTVLTDNGTHFTDPTGDG